MATWATVTNKVEVSTDVEVNQVKCTCGEDLFFEVTSDSWGMLNIKVETHSCAQDN